MSTVGLKADQEEAIADVQSQVSPVGLGETVPKNSSVGVSQSNGRVENAVQRVQGLIRTLKKSVGEEIEYENKVKRHDIPVDGSVVSRDDHKICGRLNRQNRVQRGS